MQQQAVATERKIGMPYTSTQPHNAQLVNTTMDMSTTSKHNSMAQVVPTMERAQPLELQLLPMLAIKHQSRLILDHMVVRGAFITMALATAIASLQQVYQLN